MEDCTPMRSIDYFDGSKLVYILSVFCMLATIFREYFFSASLLLSCVCSFFCLFATILRV